VTEPAPDTPAPDTFQRWCEVADVVRATTKRLEKSAALETYFPTLADDALATAARFFSGLPFPRHDQRTTSVGGAAVGEALAAVTAVSRDALRERTVAVGDLGDVARLVLEERAGGAPPARGHTLGTIATAFGELAATRGAHAKRDLVRALLATLGPAEAQYAVKLLLGSGELRIGLKEAQVEEALAKAFGHALTAGRGRQPARGDIGRGGGARPRGRLADARLALFHPLGFMLAQPLETAEAIVAALPGPFAVEDKYDGIRAQAHVGRSAMVARAWRSTRAPWTRSRTGTPRSSPPSRRWRPRAWTAPSSTASCSPTTRPTRTRLPFTAMQRRLGRKAPDAALRAEVPVQFVAYDAVAWAGELVIDEPYEARPRPLADVPGPAPSARLAPQRLVSTAEEVEAAFDAARRPATRASSPRRSPLRTPRAPRQALDQAQEGARHARRGDRGRRVGARARPSS
jgi:DNA ligase-1